MKPVLRIFLSIGAVQRMYLLWAVAGLPRTLVLGEAWGICLSLAAGLMFMVPVCREDPKTGSAKDYPQGRGPQGDAIRILNHVRLVRNIQ